MAKTPDHPAAPLLDELGGLIRHLTRLSNGPADEGVATTSTQRLALFELADDGPLRLNDLAQRVGVSAPTASRAVEALCELGLVERLPDPSDRRALRIDLTAAGRSQVAVRRQRVLDRFGPAAQALSGDEQSRLVGLLARLRSALDDDLHHDDGSTR
ncbi:MAG TPA: MarR family winged helix-turn-helix transcriptional regulator [Gaiellaceae bacterium]|nr:MarR family winged helix-turn-helix transcriptional regulator [Gaiellaceae bacterium]